MQDYLALARLTVVQYEPEDMGNFLRECGRVMQEQGEDPWGHAPSARSRAPRLCVPPQRDLTARLVNLLQRVLDTVPRGGTVTLRGRRTAFHSVVEIRDTGSAISEEQLDLLFEPLYSTGSEWIGLDLYVVREIVVAHHGTIDVQSAPGQGTTFTVTLPLVAME